MAGVDISNNSSTGRDCQRSTNGAASETIRRDSHLALGCGFGLALLVIGTLVILQLVG